MIKSKSARAALLMAALAAVPAALGALGGAVVKRLETAPIQLSATQAEFAPAPESAPAVPETAPPAPETAPVAPEPAPSPESEPAEILPPPPAPYKSAALPNLEPPQTAAPYKTESKAPFMAIPARIAAGAMAAREAEMIEGMNLSAARANARPARPNSLDNARPDPSNLAPNAEGQMQNPPQFAYKIDRPLWHSSAVVVLLHGSGADENSLMPFARPIWPRAALVGIRGRIMQGKERRWYSKITPTSFNQREAEAEADNLARFISALAEQKHWNPHKITFMGYSNGANILAILAMRYPQLVRRAILLRPMPVLDTMPQENLRHLRILTLSGARDRLYGGYAEPLYAALRRNGARVTGYRIAATHMPGRDDARIISRWLRLGY